MINSEGSTANANGNDQSVAEAMHANLEFMKKYHWKEYSARLLGDTVRSSVLGSPFGGFVPGPPPGPHGPHRP